MAVTLEGKTVLVVGAGRGIGRATAHACAEAGANVVCAARTDSEVKETAQEIASRCKIRTLAVSCDVTDYAAVEALVARCLDWAGRLDVAVNTAGILHPVMPVWKVDPGAWHANLKVNLVGAFHVTKAVAQTMMRARRGRIIHVSSGAARSVHPNWSAYCTAKAGLDHFVRAAAEELSDLGIAIYSVWPGVVDTRMQEEVRGLCPEDIGEDQLSRFRSYFEKGWLRPPEEPARLILYLATRASLADSGRVYNLDDDAVRREVAKKLNGPMMRGRGE